MTFQLSEEIIRAIQRELEQSSFAGGIMEIGGFPGCRYYVTDGEQPDGNLFPLESNLFSGLPNNKRVYLVL